MPAISVLPLKWETSFAATQKLKEKLQHRILN